MRARAAIAIASPRILASEAWNEPIADGQRKHRRFIWATQFGVGATGAGPTGYKTKPARRLAHALADRPNVNIVVKKRQEERERTLVEPPRIIWPDRSTRDAAWWATAR